MVETGWYSIFWLSIFGVLYTYIGYPIILIVWAALFKKNVKKKYSTPQVSFLVVVYNEDYVIRKKIENCLSLNYPKDKMEIVFASDGSVDQSNSIIHEYQNQGVLLYSYKVRRGKVATINRVLPKLNGEIVVFSDAREFFQKNAVKELVANFNDPTVGVVSGELILGARKSEAVGKSIRLYWEYEKRLRKREGEIYSCVGATGAIYAIRRDLFKPIPHNTVLDDMAIPFKILEQGYRIIFDRLAKAFDDVAKNSREEYGRKSRTLAGNFQILFNIGRTYHLNKTFVYFAYFSHKVSRMVLPVFFVLICISSVFINYWPYRFFFVLQLLFYSFAGIGYYMEQKGKRNSIIFHFPSVFCTMHFAIVVGFWRYVMGTQSIMWKKARGLSR